MKFRTAKFRETEEILRNLCPLTHGLRQGIPNCAEFIEIARNSAQRRSSVLPPILFRKFKKNVFLGCFCRFSDFAL